jgi:hypothetical protein
MCDAAAAHGRRRYERKQLRTALRMRRDALDVQYERLQRPHCQSSHKRARARAPCASVT